MGISPNPEAPDEVPFGKYRLRREIARGGMGVVFEAFDPELNRPVAIKVIRDDRGNAEIVRRLDREAAIVAQLRHPNIVAVHDVGVNVDASGRAVHFIAMDFLSGGTLAEVFSDPSVPCDRKLERLEEVARAVAYAHSKGVLHRDLKPENVLLDGEGRVVLTDFGLAHAETFRTRLTQSLQVLGTPQYMAPEQVEGRTREIDGRTDVYALGVMMYQILTGRQPFAGSTAAILYERIKRGEPAPPSRLKKGLSREFEIVCLKAMACEKDRRYPTALAFAQELERLRTGRPILARPPSVLHRTARFFRRWRVGFLVVAVAAVAAVVVWGVESRSRLRREKDRARAEAQEAFDRRDWNQVCLIAEGALRQSWDPVLADLGERGRKKQERVRWIREERIEPLTRRLESVRNRFYVKEANIRAELDQVERDVLELRSLAEAPEYAETAELWKLIGMGLFLTGDWDRAEAELIRAYELDPSDGQTGYYLGQTCLARIHSVRTDPDILAEVNHKEGLELLEKAKRYLPKEGQDWRGATELDRYLVRAYRVYAYGTRKELDRICEEGINVFPENLGRADLWMLRGLDYQNKNRETYLSEAIRLCPHMAVAYMARGTLYFSQNKWNAAIADLSKAVEIHPKLLRAHMELGRAWFEIGNLDKGIDSATAALGVKPNSGYAYALRGEAWSAKGDCSRALDDYAKALEFNPSQAGVRYNRGNTYIRIGDFRKAVDDYTEELKREPGFFDALCNRAQGYSMLATQEPGREQEWVASARRDYSALFETMSRRIEANAKDGWAYFHRGSAWMNLGWFANHHAEVALSIGIDPKHFSSYPAGKVAWDKLASDPSTVGNAFLDLSLLDLKKALELVHPEDRERGKVEAAYRKIEEWTK